MVELVDTHGLGPCALRHESSSLLGGTKESPAQDPQGLQTVYPEFTGELERNSQLRTFGMISPNQQLKETLCRIQVEAHSSIPKSAWKQWAVIDTTW